MKFFFAHFFRSVPWLMFGLSLVNTTLATAQIHAGFEPSSDFVFGVGGPTNASPIDYRIPCNRSWIDDTTWIPRCGALLGANRDKVGTWAQTILDHEALLGGRSLDLFHVFHGVTASPNLTAEEVALIQGGRRLFVNYKPAASWLAASGSDAATTAKIVQMAQSVAGVKPNRIMLTIHHEPENDLDSAAGRTAASYVGMWQHVRATFDAQGADNVIWVWNVMNYVTFRPLLKSLWPGNSYVDWVTWNPYIRTTAAGENQPQLVALIEEGYDWLLTNSDATANFLSKPWGLGEWGVGLETSFVNGVLDCGYAPTANKQALEFADLAVALQTNSARYKRLRMFTVFDNRCAKILTGAAGAYAAFANTRTMRQMWELPP